MHDDSAGTGIVLTADGEILTNNHVIDGATGITVTDPATGTRYRGTVVGYSIVDDLALIQLADASHLTPAPLGDSRGLVPGMAVTGVGNANGGGRLVAAPGSVLETNQTMNVGPDPYWNPVLSEPLAGLIVDSARIVGGDSGGPLLDATGKVVGVDDANNAPDKSPGAPTESLAIPIDEALSVVDRIRAGRTDGTVHVGPTATLGYVWNMYYGHMDPPGCSHEYGSGLTTPGDCVTSVDPGGPAAAIGLDANDCDVIVALNGQKVTSHHDVVAILVGLAPGQNVTVDWISQDNRHHRGVATLASGVPY